MDGEALIESFSGPFTFGNEGLRNVSERPRTHCCISPCHLFGAPRAVSTSAAAVSWSFPKRSEGVTSVPPASSSCVSALREARMDECSRMP